MTQAGSGVIELHRWQARREILQGTYLSTSDPCLTETEGVDLQERQSSSQLCAGPACWRDIFSKVYLHDSSRFERKHQSQHVLA